MQAGRHITFEDRLLMQAVRDGDEVLAASLLADGVDPMKYHQYTGGNPLIMAVLTNRAPLVRLLLDHMPGDYPCRAHLEAALDLTEREVGHHRLGTSDAHAATSLSYPDVTDVITVLMERDPKGPNQYLMIVEKALTTGRARELEALLKAGYRPRHSAFHCLLEYFKGKTDVCRGLDWAALSANVTAITRLLLDHGADPNSGGTHFITPLAALVVVRANMRRCCCIEVWKGAKIHQEACDILDVVGHLLVTHGASLTKKCGRNMQPNCIQEDVATMLCPRLGAEPYVRHIELGCKHGPLPLWLRDHFHWTPALHRNAGRKARDTIRTAMVLRDLNTPLGVMPVELMFVVFELFCTKD